MPTETWSLTAFDIPYSGDTTLPQLNIAVPATATMKRFLVSPCRISGFSQGVSPNRIVPLSLTHSVDIVSGEYSPRNIYRTSRRVPYQALVRQPVLGPDPEYTMYVNGGDNEFSVNQRCSYGTSSGPGFTVRCQSAIVAPPGSLAFPSGHIQIAFRVLYLVP